MTKLHLPVVKSDADPAEFVERACTSGAALIEVEEQYRVVGLERALKLMGDARDPELKLIDVAASVGRPLTDFVSVQESDVMLVREDSAPLPVVQDIFEHARVVAYAQCQAPAGHVWPAHMQGALCAYDDTVLVLHTV